LLHHLDSPLLDDLELLSANAYELSVILSADKRVVNKVRRTNSNA
jgi:hypothetical protein